MAPEAQHLHDAGVRLHLVHKAVLDVDAPRSGPAQLTDQGHVGPWQRRGVVGQKVQQGPGLLGAEPSVAMPSRIDSRMTGICTG